jgi:hypothetical protein
MASTEAHAIQEQAEDYREYRYGGLLELRFDYASTSFVIAHEYRDTDGVVVL